MTLYRANDRLPQDDRILVIQDMEEFNLWRERAKLGFNGLLWQHPLPLEALQTMGHQIAEALYDETNPNFIRYTNDNARLREELRLKGIERDAIDVVAELSDLFHEHVIPEREDKTSRNQLRVNSIYPDFFHSHITTLSFAFTRVGSVCRNGNSATTGDVYFFTPGQAVMFDEKIWHRAAAYEANWETDPRVNLVI